MKKLLPLISAIAFLFASCKKETITTTPIVATQNKPNIILVIADDMGLDATPGYSIGALKPNMPNLQKLINSGVRFNNLWSYPTCTPTRSSIITGKYGFRTNVLNVDDILSTSETSIQKYLDNKNSGYSHAVIGKWHLSKDANHPTNMGVGYYAGLLNGAVKSYYDWDFTENGTTKTSNEYSTTKFTDLAIDWVAKQTQPWFLWLAYNAPHTPFELPPNNLHSYGNVTDDQSVYFAMIEAMDAEFGRLLNSMSQEEKNNTVIIFIGDNGTTGTVAQEYNDKRTKGTVYQGGVNVPLIVSGYNVARVNDVEDALINTTDLFATIADIAETGTTKVNDSQSFKGLLTNKNATKRDYAYTEISQTTGSDITIRNTTHKYILFENKSEALYNLPVNYLENPNLLAAKNLPLSSSDSLQLVLLKSELDIIRTNP